MAGKQEFNRQTEIVSMASKSIDGVRFLEQDILIPIGQSHYISYSPPPNCICNVSNIGLWLVGDVPSNQGATEGSIRYQLYQYAGSNISIIQFNSAVNKLASISKGYIYNGDAEEPPIASSDISSIISNVIFDEDTPLRFYVRNDTDADLTFGFEFRIFYEKEMIRG